MANEKDDSKPDKSEGTEMEPSNKPVNKPSQEAGATKDTSVKSDSKGKSKKEDSKVNNSKDNEENDDEEITSEDVVEKKVKVPKPEEVKKYVVDKYGRNALYRGGLTIYTTLDEELQKEADAAIRNGLEGWRERHKKTKDRSSPEAALVAIDVKKGH